MNDRRKEREGGKARWSSSPPLLLLLDLRSLWTTPASSLLENLKLTEMDTLPFYPLYRYHGSPERSSKPTDPHHFDSSSLLPLPFLPLHQPSIPSLRTRSTPTSSSALRRLYQHSSFFDRLCSQVQQVEESKDPQREEKTTFVGRGRLRRRCGTQDLGRR